jgi:cytochrome c peroxidase
MKKLLIAAVVGALSSSMMLAATDAAAQNPSTTAKKTTATATPKKPAPKHRLIKRKVNPAKEAKVDPVLPGSEHWSCAEGMQFDLSGDMARDQIVTVHWANKNYRLPRQVTTTGADRFHDEATGLDLVVIPTKAMLFSDKDSSRLADECKTVAMQQGALAPTQAEALNPANRAPAAASPSNGQ